VLHTSTQHISTTRTCGQVTKLEQGFFRRIGRKDFKVFDRVLIKNQNISIE